MQSAGQQWETNVQNNRSYAMVCINMANVATSQMRECVD